MELKNKKTKTKTKGKIIPVVENNNVDKLTETNESILIQEIETQNDFLDLSNDNPINVIENKPKLFLTYFPWVLLVILLILSFYFWFQLSDIKKDPIKSAKAETTQIVNLVSKIMLLPKDESPDIATLTEDDLNKVKTQPFFINAKVGDRVLVYRIARKVILYNPSINKIIEVANLNSDNSSSLPSSI